MRFSLSVPDNALIEQMGSSPKEVAMRVDSLDAETSLVGPFKSDGVAAKRTGFPSTDITDFSMVVLVPTLAGKGIGD
jgi:hypothetical protein